MQIILQINFYLWLVACLRHALDYLAFSPLPHTACEVANVSCLRHDSRVPAARYPLIPAQAQRSVGFKGGVGRAVWGVQCGVHRVWQKQARMPLVGILACFCVCCFTSPGDPLQTSAVSLRAPESHRV